MTCITSALNKRKVTTLENTINKDAYFEKKAEKWL